jgi:hypothetical protein
MALEQMPMCGSLPATFNDAKSYGDPNPTCFLVYNRYILWGYQYAQQYGLTSKWNVTKAFTDFAALYDKPPINSAFGEMLFCDPRSNWAYSYSSRYYDECAETLSVFLKFAEQGVPGALAYADKAWAGVQNHWTGQFYTYTTSSQVVECEMGSFAQVIAEYAQQKGGTQNTSNWNRVIQDLNYKLLATGWGSPGWSSPGVIVHATINSQMRLWETMGAMMALQELYPYFSPAMQSTFQNMLMGSSKAWQGLVSSDLYVNGKFAGDDGSSPSNDATVCGAAILFLDGIVPVTGNLAVPIREENYNDYRTQFQSSQFQFDYGNHRIRIPVNKGELTFIYGSTPVSYNFPANGVYDVQFSSDWNQITSVNSQPVASAPSAPQNLKATAGNSQVALSWSAPSSDGGSAITNYTIYRSTTSGAETLYATVGNVSAYTDVTVANGPTYYYKVSASNAAGESTPSNEANATPSSMSLVVRGIDNRIYCRCWNGTDWKDWAALPGSTCDSPAVAMLGDELHVVVRGMDGSSLWHGYLTDPANVSTFSGWTLLDGATSSAPALTSNGTVLCLVVRGLDDRIYYRYYSGSWGSWQAVPTGATFDAPAAAMLGSDLHIVVRGMDGSSLWHVVANDSGVVQDWESVSGATDSKPSLTANQVAGEVYLVVRGMDNTIYYRNCTGSTDSWAGWTGLPTGATIDGPAATIMGSELCTVVRGLDGSTLWCGDIDLETNNFTGWTLLSGATLSAPTLTG